MHIPGSVLFSSVSFEALPRLNSTIWNNVHILCFLVFFGLELALHYNIPTYSVKNSVKMVIKSWVHFVTYH